MYINLCPATLALPSDDFSSLVEKGKRLGFEGIDLPGSALTSFDAALAARETVENAGLKWGIFWLPSDFSSCSDEQFRDGLKTLARILPKVQAAGCTRCYNHIWPGSNERTFVANFRWHTARLKAVTDLLSQYGVTLGLEFIGAKTLRDEFRYPFIHTLEEALELADAVSPLVGIVLDMYHLYTSGGTPLDLKKLPVDRVVNVHANDAPTGRNREEQLDTVRELPLSTGLTKGKEICLWLKESGYTGPIIAEPFSPTTDRFRSMDPEAVLTEVIRVMKELVS